MNPMLENALAQLGGKPGDSFTDNWPFGYGVDFTNIAFGQRGTGSIRIEAGTDFLVQALMLSVNLNAATTPTGFPTRAKLLRETRAGIVSATATAYAHLGQVNIQVSTHDRQWFNIPARADLVTCDPANLVMLPTPALISANDTAVVELINNLPALTGAATPAIDAQFMMLGVKMTRRGR